MAIQSSLNRLFETAGTQKAQTGTGYTNLNRFMQANQGNQLGQKVAGNLQTQVGNVQNQLGQKKEEFQTEADKNRLDTDKNKEQREAVIGRFASASTEGGNLGKDDVAQFQQFRGGQYAGPQGLQDTGALSSQAQQLAGQTSNLSPSGTQELLRRTVGDGRYTQGQQRLDSLLMDRSGLKQVGRQAQNLGSDIGRSNTAAMGTAQAYANRAQQFGTETNEALKGALGGLDTAAGQQFTTAQAAENARIAQIDNLQRTLKGDQIQKMDAQGNPVLDDNGNPVYETKLSGTTDPYARIDDVSKLLKDQGLVNTNQYEALFGKGTFAENKTAYDKQLADIKKNEVLEKILGTAQYGGSGAGLGAKLYDTINTDYATRKLGVGSYVSGANILGNLGSVIGSQSGRANSGDRVGSQLANYMASNNLDRNDPASFNVALGELYKQGSVSDADLNSMIDGSMLGGNITDTFYGDLNPVTGKRTSALEGFKSATGLAGRSTLDNRQDDFYANLSNSLGANSQAAQNLTKEQVASQPIRSNYAALSQLMGAGDTNPYTAESGYKAGTVGLDAAQIRRALGY